MRARRKWATAMAAAVSCIWLGTTSVQAVSALRSVSPEQPLAVSLSVEDINRIGLVGGAVLAGAWAADDAVTLEKSESLGQLLLTVDTDRPFSLYLQDGDGNVYSLEVTPVTGSGRTLLLRPEVESRDLWLEELRYASGSGEMRIASIKLAMRQLVGESRSVLPRDHRGDYDLRVGVVGLRHLDSSTGGPFHSSLWQAEIIGGGPGQIEPRALKRALTRNSGTPITAIAAHRWRLERGQRTHLYVLSPR